MKVWRGQPWKARARASRHCTVVSRGMSAFSDLRTEVSVDSEGPVKIVEGVQLLALGGS